MFIVTDWHPDVPNIPKHDAIKHWHTGIICVPGSTLLLHCCIASAKAVEACEGLNSQNPGPSSTGVMAFLIPAHDQ